MINFRSTLAIVMTIIPFALFAWSPDPHKASEPQVKINFHPSGYGEITGRVVDEETGDPLPNAHVKILNASFVKGTITDEQGYYTLKPLSPGLYSIEFLFAGYTSKTIENIAVEPGQVQVLNVKLMFGIYADSVQVIAWKPDKVLIDMGHPTPVTSFQKEDIEKFPSNNPVYAASLVSKSYVADEGKPVQFGGARPEATKYILEGMNVRGNLGIPNTAVNNITVINSGIPAKYGDTTSGVIIITMRSYMR